MQSKSLFSNWFGGKDKLPDTPKITKNEEDRMARTADIKVKIQGIRQRHGLSGTGVAKYLGVPISTYNKWEKGERLPSSSVLRLLEVLGIVEAMAPDIHRHFLPKRE